MLRCTEASPSMTGSGQSPLNNVRGMSAHLSIADMMGACRAAAMCQCTKSLRDSLRWWAAYLNTS
jgi:hypothetical protein